MPVPISPPAVTTRAVEALPPYVSNGVLGLRYPGLPHRCLPVIWALGGAVAISTDDTLASGLFVLVDNSATRG